jgi:hypothetical protein
MLPPANSPRSARNSAGDRLERGRLAGAVAAEQRDDRAARHDERNAAQSRDDLAVRHGDLIDLQNRGGCHG